MPFSRTTRASDESINAANLAAQRVVDELRGERKVDAEMALLIAYCNIADGTKKFRPATRDARNALFVEAGMAALVGVVKHVGEMSDQDVLFAKPTSTH